MRTIKIALVALAVGAGVALAGLPAAAATPAHAAAVAPQTCPPRPTPGFCEGN